MYFLKQQIAALNPNQVSPGGMKRLKKSARFLKAALGINASKGEFWQVALQLITSVWEQQHNMCFKQNLMGRSSRHEAVMKVCRS